MADTNNKKEVTVEDVINAAKNRNIDNNKIKMDTEPAKGTQAYIVKKALENGETLIGYQKIVSQVFDSDANTIEDDAYYLARSKDNSFHNDHGSITLKEDGTIEGIKIIIEKGEPLMTAPIEEHPIQYNLINIKRKYYKKT